MPRSTHQAQQKTITINNVSHRVFLALLEPGGPEAKLTPRVGDVSGSGRVGVTGEGGVRPEIESFCPLTGCPLPFFAVDV